MPRTIASTALPPSPLNVQLTLSGGKVIMSTTPPPGGPPGRPLNNLDSDYSHRQVLSLVCTLKYHVILLLLSHRSWGACKDGGSHFLREEACGRYFFSSPRIAIRACLVHRAKCRVRRLILKAPHDAGYGDEVGLHRKKMGKTWVKFASSTLFLSKML